MLADRSEEERYGPIDGGPAAEPIGRRPSHNTAIRREFSKQAASFEDPAYSFGDPRLLRWILSNVPHRKHDFVLDVAAGTGHLARALAPHVRHVVALDLTAAMLEIGKGAARDAGIGNVLFQLGDAGALPFLDDSFELVISRFALHHFKQPRQELEEMCRVCRSEGRVAIVDLVSPEPELAQQYNHWERLRDPTHTSALTQEQLHRLLEESGLRLENSTHHDQVLDVERWLRQADTNPEAEGRIRCALDEELAGGARTGMRPVHRDGGLSFTQRWEIAVATKRSPRGL